jgi:hypothetical protein
MPRFLLFVALAAALLADRPGNQLTQGMQLVYSSGDTENPPWTILSVRDTVLGGMTSCRVVALTTGTRPLERRLWCSRGDTLFAWDSAGSSHGVLRPIGEGMSVVASGARGNRLQYETRSALQQTVSGVTVDVIQTTLVTSDSARRPIQRLREFYAPSLATATSGIFEVPDSTVSGGWRTQTSFKLVRIVR